MRRTRVGGSASLLTGRRLLLALLAISLFLIVQLAGGAAASARGGLVLGVGEPSYRSGTNLDQAFDATVQTRAELVRIGVIWRSVSPRPPANPRDPADPAYDFSAVDAAVRAAQARGFQVLLTASLAPDWAEGPNRPSGGDVKPGTWDPDPVAFGDFAHAVATRYSGSFVDPAASGLGPLPRVQYFEVWNEPNLQTFFGPQWVNGEPRGPILYRQLLNSAYDGFKAVHPDNVVVGGSLAPYGGTPAEPRMRPLFFLRELFCLQGGGEPKPEQCPEVRMDVLSAHPINTSGGPRKSAIHPDDASSADVGKVSRVLRAAEKAGNVQPAGRRALWATEFWLWRLDRPGNMTPQRQARWLEETLYLFWQDGVEVAVYFRLQDPGDANPQGPELPLGLYSADWTPKPALRAFRFPFVTDRRSKKRVRAWGKSPQGGKLRIELRGGGKWRTVKAVRVGQREVFTANLRVRKTTKLRARVAGEQSLTWRQPG